MRLSQFYCKCLIWGATKIQWEDAEDIVTDIAEVFGIDDYLNFWDEYADVRKEEDAIYLAEKIGWL